MSISLIFYQIGKGKIHVWYWPMHVFSICMLKETLASLRILFNFFLKLKSRNMVVFMKYDINFDNTDFPVIISCLRQTVAGPARQEG